MTLRGALLLGLLGCLILAPAPAAEAQERSLDPGDYRLEGRDADGDPVSILVHVERARGRLRLERAAIPVTREDMVERSRRFVSRTVSREGDVLVVTFGRVGRGLCTTLESLDDPDEDDAPLVARYYLSDDGRRLYERARDDEGRTTYARGGADHPSLELVREARLADLLGDRLDRYEASGVEVADGKLYVVLDNSTRIAVVEPDLSDGKLIKTEGSGASNFEGLARDPVSGRFFALVEYARRGDAGDDYYGRVWELDAELGPERDTRLRGHRLAGENKGFEGLAYLRRQGEELLLALLEGNHGAGGADALDRGHGQIVVFRRRDDGRWEEHASIALPRAAAFSDYSGLDLRGDRLAVVSQTSSLLWVGRLAPDAWQVDEGTVYRFPRDGVRQRYAGVEGVAWLDDRHVVAVSDATPDCAETGESIHVFRLP